ncbi:MAG: ArnT family glycosyltransferase [Phycisphaerales bacterium JB063]
MIGRPSGKLGRYRAGAWVNAGVSGRPMSCRIRQGRHMQSKNYRWASALCLVFALAFLVRVGLACTFVGLDAAPDAGANPDQLDFEMIAWEVAQGHGFVLADGQPTARRAVGAVGTMAIPYAVTGRSYAAGRLWLVMLSSATCLLCVWIGTLAVGRGVGLLAGVGLALYPGHAYYAMHFVSETPFTFWLALGVAVTLHGSMHRWRWLHAFAGVAWGFAILTKPQFVLMIPLVIGVLLLLKLAALLRNTADEAETIPFAAAGRGSRRTGYAAVLVTCFAAGACVLPWIVRNQVVMGTPGLSTIVGHTLWGSNNEVVLTDPEWQGLWVRTSELENILGQPLPEGEAAANDAATGYAVAFAKSHLRDLPGMVLSKLYRLVTPWPATSNTAVRWAEAMTWIVAGPFALLGGLSLWRRHRAFALVMLTPIAITIAVSVVFYGSVRFRNALAPMLVVFAAAGVAWSVSLVRARMGLSANSARSASAVTC